MLQAMPELGDMWTKYMREEMKLGSNFSVRTQNTKGGQKRFKLKSAPSSIAYQLFCIMQSMRCSEVQVAPSNVQSIEQAQRQLKVKEDLQKQSQAERRLILSILEDCNITCDANEMNNFLRLMTDIMLLPELRGTNYTEWAAVGARLMVDGDGHVPIQGIPPIPDEWRAKARKRKGTLGVLRDYVRKELESGFKSIVVP